MNSQNKISIREIITGVFGGFLSYLLIAVVNMSNEDLYNWELSVIFSDGGWFNILALIMLWLWVLIMTIWIISIIVRVIKKFT